MKMMNRAKVKNLLNRCFRGTANVPKRLLKVPASVEKAEAHIEKANRNLFAATLMNENKLFDWTITCAYYAMYHATMASLWLIGINARSHECAIIAFETFYVRARKVDREYLEYVKKTEKLSKKYANSLEHARTERIKASYGLGELTSREAALLLDEARAFVTEITRLVFEAKGISYHNNA